jgi:integrase
MMKGYYVVPISPNLQKIINKVGVKKSPFVLGILKEGYEEITLANKKDWQQQKLNKCLKYISEKLGLSVDLRLKTSRDSYATTLKRSGKSRDEIGEMMGHSTSQVTEHYLASLDVDIDMGIPKRSFLDLTLCLSWVEL